MEPTIDMKKTDSFFLETAMKYWPVLVAVITAVSMWTHFQTTILDLAKQVSETQARVTTVETSTQAASVNYAVLSGKIDTVNANINILLKQGNLQ